MLILYQTTKGYNEKFLNSKLKTVNIKADKPTRKSDHIEEPKTNIRLPEEDSLCNFKLMIRDYIYHSDLTFSASL